jgi:hypothetical protein
MPGRIDFDEIPPDQLKALGLRRPKSKGATMPRDRIRGYALKILGSLSELTPAERRRILDFAQKLNRL